MSDAAPHFQRFIVKLRRRAVFFHAVTRMGESLAVGCLIGMLAVSVQWWRGGTAGLVTLVSLCASVLIGMVRAVMSCPTRLQVAMHADRQLNLSDLLGSALMVRQTNPWSTTVLALADAHCVTQKPSSILVVGWNRRHWAGLLLAMTLLFLSAISLTIKKAAISHSSLAVMAIQDDLGVTQQSSSRYSPPPTRVGTHPNPEDNDTANADSTAQAETNEKASTPNTTTPEQQQQNSPNNPTGAGSGSGQTQVKSALPPVDQAGQGSQPSSNRQVASDGQADNTLIDGSGENALGNITATPAAPPVATTPVMTDITSTERILQQTLRQTMYDSYRPLLRDYFNRR